MRLRNKKTGKIWHMPRLRQPTVQEDDISFFACIGEHGCSRGELFSYKSLAELNADWEDYAPAEPEIEDETARETIRKWYDKNRIVGKLRSYGGESWLGLRGDDESGNSWKIELHVEYFSELIDGKLYSLTELCGEEKE